ncbi:hypothetical protein [Candidatus Cyanaurora vandensis]|uniref:hypothetical protein n=1 Tax=Candidatus Cyanaurora vandensis TaxID=2714958 RepID=UPI00257D8187|nr:hypothetical protein [Candidatus Cyanaurora vandensis]
MPLLGLLLLAAPVAPATLPTVQVPFDRNGLPRSTLFRVEDTFEGYHYLGVKDVDSSPNPLGCAQDFVTYWLFYPKGTRQTQSGALGGSGTPYATVTVLLDGSNFCASFPPVEELALRIGNQVWRLRGALLADNGVRVPAGPEMGLPINGINIPYQLVLGGLQTKTKNQFILPPDFIAALLKSPVQNIPARAYHPEDGVSQFQIGAQTVMAWKDLFRTYPRNKRG